MGLTTIFKSEVRDILRGLASAGHHRGPKYHQALLDVSVALGLDEYGERRRGRESMAGYCDAAHQPRLMGSYRTSVGQTSAMKGHHRPWLKLLAQDMPTRTQSQRCTSRAR